MRQIIKEIFKYNNFELILSIFRFFEFDNRKFDKTISYSINPEPFINCVIKRLSFLVFLYTIVELKNSSEWFSIGVSLRF